MDAGLLVLVLSAVFTVGVFSAVIFWIIYREVVRSRPSGETAEDGSGKRGDP